LADRLTFAGVEVEGLARVGGGVAGVVVGEVTAIEKHPNADKLTLCQVAFGGAAETDGGVRGAERGGGREVSVRAAGDGAAVRDHDREAQGARGVQRGHAVRRGRAGDFGDHTGLMELDGKWAPGTPLAEVLGPPETVIEVEITPNRPDCLSLLGLAREVAALYGTQVKAPDTTLAEVPPGVETATSVIVEDLTDCPRYTARVLRDVRVGPSPDWLKRRLEAAGVRAINNIVDITNYVMLECGQPLHAFDQRLLAEGRIVVRHPEAGREDPDARRGGAGTGAADAGDCRRGEADGGGGGDGRGAQRDQRDARRTCCWRARISGRRRSGRRARSWGCCRTRRTGSCAGWMRSWRSSAAGGRRN
jgi:phenylalanyl-tRNA synthetase beta chain